MSPIGKVNLKNNRSIFEPETYSIVETKIMNIKKVEKGLAKIVFSAFEIILLQRKLAKAAPANAHMAFPIDNSSVGIGRNAKYKIIKHTIKTGKIKNHAFRLVLRPIKAPSAPRRAITIGG